MARTKYFVKATNIRLDERAKEVNQMLKADGLMSCLLKGLGTAMLYPELERRQCGDIDLWVEGERDKIVASGDYEALKNNVIKLRNMPQNEFREMSSNCIRTSREELNFEKQMVACIEWIRTIIQ